MKRVKLFDLDDDVQAVLVKVFDEEEQKAAIQVTFFDQVGDGAANVDTKVTAGYDSEEKRDEEFNTQTVERLQVFFNQVSKTYK